MDDAAPGLFDLPGPEPQAQPSRTQVGRNRQTWTLTATAEVTIVDAAAVEDAVVRYHENTVGIDARSGAISEDPALHDSGPVPTLQAVDQLAWLIWPTDGLETLMEEGVFRILSAKSAVEAESADRGTATWSVTVKLTDVHLLQRLATQAHPQDATLIADSLSLAWQRATDPFAPLRTIPGISWRPVAVDVEHLPARTAARNG